MLRDPHEAEDATHEVFVKLLEALPRLENRPGGFGPWLNQVSMNHARDRLRRRRFDPAEPEAILARLDAEAAAAGVRWRDHTATEVVALLDGLSPLQRQVVFLRVVAELTSGEVADLLETTPGTVRQTLYMALKALGSALEGDRAPARREAPLAFRRFAPPRAASRSGFALRLRWVGALRSW